MDCWSEKVNYELDPSVRIWIILVIRLDFSFGMYILIYLLQLSYCLKVVHVIYGYLNLVLDNSQQMLQYIKVKFPSL